MILPDFLVPYKVYIVNGAVGVALGLATKNILKMETVNAKDLKSGALSFLTIGVGTYLSESLLKDI